MSVFRSTFRWTSYSIGITLSVISVTLGLDTFIKINRISRIIPHYPTWQIVSLKRRTHDESVQVMSVMSVS